jgi:ATP-dependent protease HslVU (ClpYQ) ATPase subunit
MDSAEEKEQRPHMEEEGEEEEVEEEEVDVELEGEERAAVIENAKPTVHHIRLQIQRRMSANNHIQTSTKTVVEYSPAGRVC